MDEIKIETVLGVKIDALAKLTDERLLNLKEGIADLKILMQGFVTKAELQEVKNDFNLTIKRIEDGFTEHNKDDKKNFGELTVGQQELRDTILKWGAVMGAVLIVLSFLSPVILKYWFHIG